MRRAPHQMPKPVGRVAERLGEARTEAASDEARLPRHAPEDAGRDLLAQALARQNMQRAWKRVKANKGAAGVDGLDIEQTGQYLQHAWPTIKQQLLDGTYRPQPVRRVGIAKPDGSERELGIPTVTDRLIQQALLQVLQPLIDPTFSEHSYGFRPGRSARCYDKLHLAINASKSAVTSAVGRKFLGYALWVDRHGVTKCAVAEPTLETFRQRIRVLTRRSSGRSITAVIEQLRRYVLGWKAYFQLAHTPRRWLRLDEWMRRRMRALHLKHWRRGPTIYRELRRLRATVPVAQSVAALSNRYWHNSNTALNHVLTIVYFDRLGMPRLT